MLGMGSPSHLLAASPVHSVAACGGHQSHWHQPGPGDVESRAIININAFEYPRDL